jgi:calcineurin-like phosphoesterase family protein
MSLTYVIPDLHGRSDLLQDGLALIAAHARGGYGSLIALGDYVDKGPDSKAVIELLRADPLPGWPFIPLKGNHDAMMVEALRDPQKMQGWLNRGGDTTLASYGGNPALVPSGDIEWLDGLALVHADRWRIYVHAGLDPDSPLEQQSEKTLLTKRYREGDASAFGSRHIVHGHDSQADGPKLYEGRSNLDAQAWRTGRLVIAVFDDDTPGGPIDFIRVQGPPG